MNYTISEIKYEDVPTGTQVSTIHPTGTMTLVPNPGYSLTAIDFGWQSTNPYINDVVFTQSGANLTATITFEPTFVMPANNLEIPLCFSKGDGVLIDYTVSGTVQPVVGANITSFPGTAVLPFTADGNFNNSITVFTGTLTCAAGYYMAVPPVVVQNTGDTTNFTISYNDTYSSGLLTARQYTITYLVPNYDSSGNSFSINALADKIYVPAIKVLSYSTSNELLFAGGDIRSITIIGNQGANWELSSTNSILLQSDGISTGPSLTGTLDETGVTETFILVPPVSTNTAYSVKLEGDLVSPFPQPVDILYYQYIDTNVTYNTGSPSLFVNSGTIVNSGAPLSFTTEGMSGYNTVISWNITPVYGMILVAPASVNYWDNINPLLNNGTSFDIESLSATQISGSLIEIEGVTRILQYGIQNMTTTLQLDKFIAFITTAVVTSIGTNTATTGSSVDYAGTGGAIGERGLCYSTTASPTVANIKVIQSPGFGVRNTTLTGLAGTTTYYVRSYCYNTSGSVYYGNQQTFTTL